MTFDILVISSYFRTILQYTAMLSSFAGLALWLTGYLGKIVNTTFGFTSNDEQKKFSLLSLCFALILATYTVLRTMKEAIFFDLVGGAFLPKARMITPFILIALLFILNIIVNRIKKEHLFLVVTLFYASIFIIAGILLNSGMPEFNSPYINWIPGRAIGWILYWSVETLGSIIVGAVFWAFIASTTKTDSAKRGFPMIFLFGQTGQFIGSALITAFAITTGKAKILFLCSGVLLMIPILMKLYMMVLPKEIHESDNASSSNQPKTSAIEGLRLIITKPFLLGIAFITTIYEIVGTIIEYQFYTISNLSFPISEEFTAFLGFFTMNYAILSIIFSIIGTGFFLKKFGVRFSLLIFPTLLLITVLMLMFNPALWPFFAAMVIFKSLNYTLNNPVKELLYLPTSNDVKLKSKGFIDALGSRGTKGIGSLINNTLKDSPEMLFLYGSMLSMGVIGLWILVAIVVGLKYDQLMSSKKILE